MEFTYSKPETNEVNISTRPQGLDGRGFPLSQMHPRDFEMLLYFLYKQEIEDGSKPYDDVALMQGIKDNAQDCALYKDERKVAIIQCKHSRQDRPIGLKSCMDELIKFCLYSVKDPKLIPDKNAFTYILATSAGLASKAETYFSSFRESLAHDANLKTWTEKVIRDVKALGDLNPDSVQDQLREILSSIRIKIESPQDIQSLLVKHQSVIAPMFFDLRMVVDSSKVEELTAYVGSLIAQTQPKHIETAKILREFDIASFFLSTYRSTFTLKSPMSIKRKETEQMLNWVTSPLPPQSSNIAVLKGGAGSGKSVILNNLYSSLKDLSIPCIGLKADIKGAHSIEELEKGLNLTNSIEESIMTLEGEYPKIVIVIDQIDALSQTLSASRDFLGTYMTLIEKMRAFDSVRIVVSVREYDLAYDPLLIPLQKNTAFEAKKLDEKEVTEVLNSLNVSNRPTALIDLLRTPLHLELFCQVYNSSERHVVFNSLYDLYNVLWSRKIGARSSKADRDSTINTAYSLAAKMYENQTLHVNSALFDPGDIEFLKTQGLIRTNEKSREVLFFHQTFYDYVFARQFVEKKTSVVDYLDANSQGLHIRSSLRIILAHLREYSFPDYKRLLETLLLNPNIRFHLRLLTLNYLGFVDDPNQIEINVIEDHIIGTDLEECFIESIGTDAWVKEAIAREWIGKLIKSTDVRQMDLAFQFYRRNMRVAFDSLMQFLKELPNDEKTHHFIAQTMLFIPSWNENVKILYYRVKNLLVKKPFIITHCLENAMLFDQDWAHTEFRALIGERLSKVTSESQLELDHTEIELLKKFYRSNLLQTHYLNQKILEDLLSAFEINLEGKYLLSSGTFPFFSRKDIYRPKDELLGLFIDKAEEIARSDADHFRTIASSLIASRQTIFIKVVVYAYLSNPKEYINDIYELFKLFHEHTSFEGDSDINHFVRKLLKASYSFFSEDQKKDVMSIIDSLKFKDEVYLYNHPITLKRTRYNYIGYSKHMLLCSIPEPEIKRFPNIYRTFLELERKFGKIKDRELSESILRPVPAPYTAKNYQSMSLSDWEMTFRKHHDTKDYHRDYSLTEHGRSFETEVSNRPAHFYTLVKKMIGDNSINTDYKIFGITGLMKGSYEINKVQELYTDLIAQGVSQEYLIQIIWASDYLIKNNGANDAIVDFLCFQALNNGSPNRDDIEKPRDVGITSVRGGAVDKLLTISDTRHSKKLLEAAEQLIATEKTLAVKVIFISHCAFLLNHSRDKAFDIFNTAISKDKRLLKHAMWSASHFARSYFSQMSEFFDAAEKKADCHQDLTVIYYTAWLHDIAGAETRLFRLLKKSKSARCEAVQIAMNSQNLLRKDNILEPRCLKLIDYTIKRKDKEIWREYSNAFLRFDNSVFELLLPIMSQYSKSQAFKNYPAYFCLYITQSCSKKTVKDCIKLISHLDKLVEPDISSHGFYRSEPLNALLAVYNTLDNEQQSVKAKNHCMDIFDRMLLQPQHREGAYRAIEITDMAY